MPPYSQLFAIQEQTTRRNFRRKWRRFLLRTGDWFTRARLLTRASVREALAAEPDEITIVYNRLDPGEHHCAMIAIREAVLANPYITIKIISHV